MTKLVLQDIASLTNEQSALGSLNANSQAIETFSDSVLSRDGTTPNQMQADLDMNSNRILNLPEPVNSNEPLRVQDLADFNSLGTITVPALATQAEAEAGTNNTKFMSPLRVEQRLESDFVQPSQFPIVTANGHKIVWADEDVNFGNSYSNYPLGCVSAYPTVVGHAGSSIGSSTVGQTFSLRFTSTGLTGSPITITYTAVGGDTTATIAASLCSLINANSVLHDATTGQPIFAQSFTGSATFNIQYTWPFSSIGSTPLTIASVGTGTINLPTQSDALDFVVMQLGRNVPGRAGQAGDALYGLDFTGKSSAGFDTHYAQITVAAKNATAGAQRGHIHIHTAEGNSSVERLHVEQGLVINTSTGAEPTGGDKGPGTINVPSAGGYYFSGDAAVSQAGIVVPTAASGFLYGGQAAGSVLNLSSTTNGAPSADAVQIHTGGSARWAVNSSGHIQAQADNTYDLGVGGARPRNINIAGSLTTGGQIVFPATQNASANANTLDDYEEGTWTPAITFGGGSTGITYTTQSGFYTKIGRLVQFSCLLVLTSKGSSTGTALITGLPFTDGSTTNSVNFFANNMAAAAVTMLMGFVTGTTIDLRRYATGTATAMTDTDFNNNSVLRVSGTYQV